MAPDAPHSTMSARLRLRGGERAPIHPSASMSLEQGVYRLGGYLEQAPPPGLGAMASAVWTYVRPAVGVPPIPGAGHRVLPEAGVSLCLLSRHDGDGHLQDARLLLMGPIRSIRFFQPEPGLHLVGVRLHPEWCQDLLGLSPGEHVDALDELPACRSLRADDFLGPLAAAPTPGTAASILLARLGHLAERMRVSRQTTLAHAVLERIRSDGGPHPLRLPQLARELGWSERTLRRAVQGVARFGPKHFQRVYRLARAVAAADASPAPSWARIAAATGYFDQSHLIQEFLAFTGLPPHDLLRERHVQATAEPR